MIIQPVQLAAQADLVLLTVEMLRAPQTDPAGPADWRYDRLSDWRACLQAARLPASTTSTGTTLESACTEVFEMARRTSTTEWADEFWRLFDGPTICPINQASYDRRDKGTILGDLSGFYRAFGWEHATGSGERPDHLRCQLEFVAVLLAMAGQASTDEQQEIATEGLSRFARIHMHDWLPSFGWHLCEVTRLPLYGALATWLVMLWDGLTVYHQWPADERPPARLKPQTETETETENLYQCAGQHKCQHP